MREHDDSCQQLSWHVTATEHRCTPAVALSLVANRIPVAQNCTLCVRTCRTPGPDETISTGAMRKSPDFPTSDQATDEGMRGAAAGVRLFSLNWRQGHVTKQQHVHATTPELAQ